MPELLTLVVVACLGVLVGAAGVTAFRVSEHIRHREQVVDIDPEAIPAEALAILAVIPEITVLLDRDNRVIRAEAAAFSKSLVRGERVAHPAVEKLVAQVRHSGMTMSTSMSLPRSQVPGASNLDFSIHVAPLPAGRVLILAQDVTIERRNEQVRRDFTANVSHELKTPIGAIRLLAETIAEDPTDASAIEHFAPRLTKEADRLSALVHDIIELSRLQAPDALEHAELVSVAGVITRCLEQHATVAEAAGISVVGPQRTSGVKVWGNQAQLDMALNNLVDNALHYSPTGSTVRVGIQQKGGLAEIWVQDHGIGIASDQQQRIFERFYRVDPARSRSTGGTGLGLSIVKHVANDHGGAVSVASTLGEGSTFTLMLPVANGDEPPTTTRSLSSRSLLEGAQDQ